MDPDVVDEIRAALDESERVDARRIRLVPEAAEVVLQGSVASPEEASAAALIAERYAPHVRSELQVDENLREGVEDPADAESATPAEDEVLVGDPDMLAGPGAEAETDLSVAMEENVPWQPPDEPHLAPTTSEYRSPLSDGGPEAVDERPPAPDEVGREDYAAADLTREELELGRPEQVPSGDREEVQPSALAQPEPAGVDDFGRTPPEDLEPMVEPVPDAPAGIGATGEGTAGGGGLSGEPATETGAKGADTAAADPVRTGTGGTMTDSGTARGPEGREQEAVREDFPDREPEGT